ncbi:MAG: hypothetical protein KY476_03705 [Planctomycetes bacterium]|nr:hypothetical protein [Planctomycetota bacterium]
MNALRVFRGTDSDDPHTDDAGPVVIPFGGRFERRQGVDPVLRARLLHDNRLCPTCHHPVVEPLELNDGLMSRNRRPVPGTGTLVGFHCRGCDREWPA